MGDLVKPEPIFQRKLETHGNQICISREPFLIYTLLTFHISAVCLIVFSLEMVRYLKFYPNPNLPKNPVFSTENNLHFLSRSSKYIFPHAIQTMCKASLEGNRRETGKRDYLPVTNVFCYMVLVKSSVLKTISTTISYDLPLKTRNLHYRKNNITRNTE